MSGEKVATGVGGRVLEVNFHEGDLVKKGDVLMRLDTERLDNEVARATGTLEAAREEIAKLERLRELQGAQRDAARAKAQADLTRAGEQACRDHERRDRDVRLAEIELGAAEQEERRAVALVESGVLPRIDHEKAARQVAEGRERLGRAQVAVDESAVEAARRALELVDREHALRDEELAIRLAAKRGEAQSGARTLANLELEHEQSVIRAHVDGIVTVGDVKVGDLIEPGAPVMAIAQQKGFRVDVAVSSADIAFVRTGMRARVKLDAYDWQKYGTLEGTVYHVSPDSQVNEQTRVMYYVVRARLERPQLAGQPVKLGMTAQVEILTGEERVLSLALRRVSSGLSPR